MGLETIPLSKNKAADRAASELYSRCVPGTSSAATGEWPRKRLESIPAISGQSRRAVRKVGRSGHDRPSSRPVASHATASGTSVECPRHLPRNVRA
jgi:hypothetical protein